MREIAAGKLSTEQIQADVRRLRPLAGNVVRIIKILEEDAGAKTISDMISLDQVLSAQVLEMANSALLGYGPTCTSIHEAVMRLGFDRVRTLVLAAAASGPLKRRMTGYRLAAGELWHHSVSSAAAANVVAKVVAYPDPEEAYVVGLLHDIGKVVLDQYIRVDYTRIMSSVRINRIPIWQAEEAIFGFCHATVGGMAAARWSFPQDLVDAIQFHHAPSLAHKRQDLAAIANIANALTPAYGSLGEIEPRMPHPEALRILGLLEGGLERIQQEIARVIHQTELKGNR